MEKLTSPLIAFLLCLSLALSYALSGNLILTDRFEGGPSFGHAEFCLLPAIVSTPADDAVTVTGETHWIQGDARQVAVTNTHTNFQALAVVQDDDGFTLALPQTRRDLT